VLVASDREARTLRRERDQGKQAPGRGPDQERRRAHGGPGYIDLDYLLGANGGHLNVSGAAGRATKSSFLLTVIYLLLAKAEQERRANPSGQDRLRIVPIIFNVKNYDCSTLTSRAANTTPKNTTRCGGRSA
jgi:hypothetical protein